jgi:hypothetical protein
MTQPRPTVIGLELLVPDIAPALETLTSALGCEIAWTGPSAGLDADVAVLDAGPITITLISPTRTGRRAIPDQQPRLTQLVFGVEEPGVSQVITGLRSLGLAVEDGDGGRPYIPPAVAEGVLGWRAALVVTPLSPADEAADDEGGQTGPRG